MGDASISPIDIDSDNWLARFDRSIQPILDGCDVDAVLAENYQYREMYLDQIFSLIDKCALFEKANKWARRQKFWLRHGTRLHQDEFQNVVSYGLIPLKEQSRFSGLARIVEEVSDASQKKLNLARLDDSIKKHADRDRGAIYFSLSGKFLLLRPASHYLYYGSEFGLVVLGESIGSAGKSKFREMTLPTIVSYIFRGSQLTSKKSIDEIEETLNNGNSPEFENLLLNIWLLWKLGYGPDDDRWEFEYCYIHRGSLPGSGVPDNVRIVDSREIEPPDVLLGR